VFLCGNDQGASACGSGLKQAGDVTINFGTAMVFYTITKYLPDDLTENQIAGKHPVGDDYFLLNWESDFGIQIRRLKQSFFQNCSYDRLFQSFKGYPDIEELIPPTEQPDADSFSPVEQQRFCAGIIKFYINRLKTHLAQIQHVCSLNNIYLSGGMTQSKVWLEIVSNTLNQPFTVNNSANASLFGAVNIYLHRQNRSADLD